MDIKRRLRSVESKSISSIPAVRGHLFSILLFYPIYTHMNNICECILFYNTILSFLHLSRCGPLLPSVRPVNQPRETVYYLPTPTPVVTRRGRDEYATRFKIARV